MKPETVKYIVERVVVYLRREGFYVAHCEIKARRGEFEVFMRLERNVANIPSIKVVFSRRSGKFFVFTGRTSLDLRLKRIIKRLLEAEKREIALQEENSSSS